MKKYSLFALLPALMYAGSFESGVAFDCLKKAEYIGIESNTGLMAYCKSCTADTLVATGARNPKQVAKLDMEQICSDANLELIALKYKTSQNK